MSITRSGVGIRRSGASPSGLGSNVQTIDGSRDFSTLAGAGLTPYIVFPVPTSFVGVAQFVARVRGFAQGLPAGCAYELQAAVMQNGGAPTLEATVQVAVMENAGLATANATISVIGTNVRINVQPTAIDNLTWNGVLYVYS